MVEDKFQTSKALEKALQDEADAKRRREEALKILSKKKRTFENQRKYFIGGTVHKYFKECFLCEDGEIDEIIKVAFESIDVKRAIERVRRGANPPVARPVNVTTTVEDSDD